MRIAKDLNEFEKLCESLEQEAPAVANNETDAPENIQPSGDFYDMFKNLMLRFSKIGVEFERIIRDPATPDSVRSDLVEFDSRMNKLYIDMFGYAQKLKEDAFSGNKETSNEVPQPRKSEEPA